ncbi:MAG: ATP-binding protein [Nocardioides sp.]
MGVEAAAREARYARPRRAGGAPGAATVLLGHTRDDQAETVLLGLARGSGPRSLAGMRRRFECFRRPLLDLSRVDTDAACRAEDLPHLVRPAQRRPCVHPVAGAAQVLPVLEEELGPGVPTALARTADLLRRTSTTSTVSPSRRPPGSAPPAGGRSGGPAGRRPPPRAAAARAGRRRCPRPTSRTAT